MKFQVSFRAERESVCVFSGMQYVSFYGLSHVCYRVLAHYSGRAGLQNLHFHTVGVTLLVVPYVAYCTEN